MKSVIFLVATSMGFAAALPNTAQAITLDVNPTNDAITYGFLPTTAMKTVFGGVYANVLSTGGTSNTASPGTHDTRSLVQFDLSSSGLTPSQLTSATLNLYVVSASTLPSPALGADADASHQIGVDAWQLGSSPAWAESTVTWNTSPATTGGVLDTATVSGINQWVQLDVTSAVLNWLTSPSANNGLLLTPVNPRVNNGEGVATVAIFDTTGGGEFEAFLQIETTEAVPEPSTWALAGVMGLGLLSCCCWRRFKRREGCGA